MAQGSPTRAYVRQLPSHHTIRSGDGPTLSLAALQGFVAKPINLPDGSQNILSWDCVIPGKPDGLWANARIPLTMTFTEDYPSKPPECKFKLVSTPGGNKALFHPNVYPSGKICLSLLDPEKGWRPSLTIKQLLLGIQTLLDDPNNADPAQEEPYRVFASDKPKYERMVKAQVALLAP